jgi:pimeloyl-ACP methyl ester carboxylesterase
MLFALSCVFSLPGCTTFQRTAHLYGNAAPPAHTFQYRDGGSSVYYTFTVGTAAQPDTLIFFYGATGCPSWKSVMPEYVDGLMVDARVFVLNKRFVPDRSTGMFGCSREFHLANNPDQWAADHANFIAAQLAGASPPPKNVVLVGVSEGALSAIKIAARAPQVTHLAIIGAGAYPMRRSLATLAQKGAIRFDVEAGWKEIAAEPASIDKNWYGNPYRWWTDVMDIDPLPDLLKLDMPILLGIGERDESVPVESARFLASQFEVAGKRNLTLRVYPDADHRLSANGVSHRDEFFGELSRILQAPPANTP